jgi:hypothetical protein
MGPKKRLAILVLSNQSAPWCNILEKGAKPTWIAHSQNQAKIYTYTGIKPSILLSIRESISGRLRHTKFKFIQIKFDTLFTGIFELNLENQRIVGRQILQCQPEVHSTIGARTLAAFHAMLLDHSWDYLWRANVSNYVNVEALEDILERLPLIQVAGGVTNYYDKEEYLSGAGFLLSRDVVEQLCENSQIWDHSYLDDVALGFALSKLGIRLTEIPRLRITRHQEVNKIPVETLMSTPSFRCNGLHNRQEDIKIMQALHQTLCGEEHA